MPEDPYPNLTKALRSVTPLVALVLASVSTLSSLTIPRVKPVYVVLSVFFGILALVVIAQLVLYWNGLKSQEERGAFVGTLVYGAFLFVLMVGGMFARYFWELFQGGKTLDDADLKVLLLPLLVSLMVFYPLWSIASGAPRNFFSVVAAFQNGFFWQTIFSILSLLPGKMADAISGEYQALPPVPPTAEGPVVHQ